MAQGHIINIQTFKHWEANPTGGGVVAEMEWFVHDRTKKNTKDGFPYVHCVCAVTYLRY